MGINGIRFYNFRNIENFSLKLGNPEVFFIGKNAQGKSNLLEAVYYICFGSSFRTKSWKEMLRDPHDDLVLEADLIDSAGLEKRIKIRIKRNAGRDFQINGHAIKDRKEIIYNLPCIAFTHADLNYVTGKMDSRRNLFNQIIGLTSPVYLDLLRQYNRVLRQRNLCLKQENYALLPIYNSQLVEYGQEIQAVREEAAREFNLTLTSVYNKMLKSREQVFIRYSSSWQVHRGRESLEKHERRDKIFRTTTSGPHRDRFYYFQNEQEFTSRASTGQCRLLSLVLRLAQAVYMTERTGKKPLLLLDDVLLELDKSRKLDFLNNLPPYEQVFFTFLPEENYTDYAKPTTRLLKVEEGRLEDWYNAERR